MTSASVSTYVDGEIHLVRLDDSAVNALSLDLIDELSTAITAAKHGGALVIVGRPGCFTAGLDRSVMLGGDRAAVSTVLRRVTELYEQVLAHPAPTVIGCTGHALAAGALFLLVADARIGVTSPSKIGLNETQIGVPLGPLAVAAARMRLAPQALVRATLHGAIYSAPEAVNVGYLDEIVDPDEVVSSAMRTAAGLARLDRRAYLRARALIWAPALAEVESALARRRTGAATLAGADASG